MTSFILLDRFRTLESLNFLDSEEDRSMNF